VAIFVYRTVLFVCSVCTERSQNQASLLCYRSSFKKGLLELQTISGISCTAEVKVLFKVCLWVKILLSVVNLASTTVKSNQSWMWQFSEWSRSGVTVSKFFDSGWCQPQISPFLRMTDREKSSGRHWDGSGSDWFSIRTMNSKHFWFDNLLHCTPEKYECTTGSSPLSNIYGH